MTPGTPKTSAGVVAQRRRTAGMRAAHPVCGWLRLGLLPASLVPLVLAPGWPGALAGLLVLAAWLLLPLAVAMPISDRAWMARAALGAHIWRHRPLDDLPALGLAALAAVGLAAAALCLAPLRPLPLAAALLVHSAGHLAFLWRTARFYGALVHRRQ